MKKGTQTLLDVEVVHYVGHIIAPPDTGGRFPAALEDRVAADIAAALAPLRVGLAYGALAAGADIMFAEALLRHGAALHVVLPFDRDDFIALSVRPAGLNWVTRFETCLSQASTIRTATDERQLGRDHLFADGSKLAMELAMHQAGALRAPVRQLALWDGAPPAAVSGTAVDIATWRSAGLPSMVIPLVKPTRHGV